MRLAIVFVALVLICGLAGGVLSAEEARPPELKKLTVLYAGHPDSDRMARFRDFLTPWVKQVETISLKDLHAKNAEPFDVVIADWARRYGEGGYQPAESHGISLARDFKKPVVMIGAVAGEAVRPWSKINWL